MKRLPDLSPATLTERQKETYTRIATGPRGRVVGPLAAWLRIPDFADRAEALGTYCRFHNSLPDRLNELAILIVAKYWRAGFAWRGHAELAQQTTLSRAIAEAIRNGTPPEFEVEDERIVFAVVDELMSTRELRDETWMAAIATLGEAGFMDLIGIAGYYCLVAMTIKAWGIGAELDSSLVEPRIDG